jgi:tRNA(Met) cytidine acetyltransferase
LDPAEPTAIHRTCQVLAGGRAWAWGLLREALQGLPAEQLMWVGEEAPAGIQALPPRQVQRWLGGECRLLVFDALDGFHPDVFAAALGTLAGGGQLWLLLPAWEDWAHCADRQRDRLAPFPLDAAAVGGRFIERLRDLFAQAECVRVARPTDVPPAPDFAALLRPRSNRPWVLTPDQQAAVGQIRRVARGRARRPLVLTADRGRGKSTALGAAIADLLRGGLQQVLVVAPAHNAVQALFAQLRRELPDGAMHGNDFVRGTCRVRFCLAAEQVGSPEPCDLLVVDEAAAIGLALLETLLQHHARVVFSTTVHGYEGSGRGFALRFMRVLDQRCPQWRALELQQPVRWAAGDPLEALLNRALLLDAEPAALDDGAGPVHYRWVTQAQLGQDAALLEQLFALLVAAHYQTRPSDLQQLLDAPGLHIQVALCGELPVGALLLVSEGGFDDILAQAVCRGERRPRGHMLLQSLAQHAGLCEAPRLRLWRVMRIAVRGELRRRGIGSSMLRHARAQAVSAGVDLLGSAFALDERLLPFWRAAGFAVARLGERRDASSGMHSVQMLAGLSVAGRELQRRAHARFHAQFPWRLATSFRQLPAALALPLLQGRECGDLPLDAQDRADAHAFALAHRGFADAQPALWRLVCHAFAGGAAGLPVQQRELLLAALLQNRPCAEIRQRTGIDGRQAQQQALRGAVKNLLHNG